MNSIVVSQRARFVEQIYSTQNMCFNFFVVKGKNEWSNTSTSPTCLNVMDKTILPLYIVSHFEFSMFSS